MTIRTLRLLFDDDDLLVPFERIELRFDLVLKLLSCDDELRRIFVMDRGFLARGASLILSDSEYMLVCDLPVDYFDAPPQKR